MYTIILELKNTNAEITRKLDLQNGKSMLLFAVINMIDNKVVGKTTNMNSDRDNNIVEIKHLVCWVYSIYNFEYKMQINAIRARI